MAGPLLSKRSFYSDPITGEADAASSLGEVALRAQFAVPHHDFTL